MTSTTQKQYGIFTIAETTKPERLTPIQFNKFIRLNHPKEFICSDENNTEYKQNRIIKDMHEPMFLRLFFNEIGYNPDVTGYTFKNGDNILCIASVKYITVEPSLLGNVATFHCKHYDTDKTIAYTVVIR